MWLEADYWEDKVWVRPHDVPPNQYGANKEAARRVPGGRWIPKYRAWRYPASVEVCVSLREVWGPLLRVRTDLADWFRVAKQEADAQALRARQSDAILVRLPEYAPALASALRPDQRAGAAWFAQGYRDGGLLADQPGTGKTLVSIAGILESDVVGPILCIAPKLAVKRVWHREWSKWTRVPVFFCRGTKVSRQRTIAKFFACPSEDKVLVIVAEMLRVSRERRKVDKETGEYLEPANVRHHRGRTTGFAFPELFDAKRLDGGWAWVVTDESHKLLGSLSIRKANLAGEGLVLLPLREGGQKRAVTGTPWGKGGRAYGLFGTLHWLWPDEHTSFWRWADQHFRIEEDEYYVRGGGGLTKKTTRLGDLKENPEALLRSLGPRIMRRTKAEVLKYLPAKQYIEVLCDLTPGQIRQYQELSDNAEFVTENGVVIVNGSLALHTRARQLANGTLTTVRPSGHVTFGDESGKLEEFFELMEARGITDGEPQHYEDDIKCVVASQFNEFLYALERRLKAAKIPYYILTGKTSDKERDRIMDKFQQFGGPRLFLINSVAGGVSVTLDAADELHLLDEEGDPGDNEQIEDRIHRASRIHKVRIFTYRSAGTIDETVAHDSEGRRIAQWRILDEPRGVPYMRELIKYRKEGQP